MLSETGLFREEIRRGSQTWSRFSGWVPLFHDNRMLAERAFYCLIPESKGHLVVSKHGILHQSDSYIAHKYSQNDRTRRERKSNGELSEIPP